MKRALFLDRDGTINIDHGYIRDPALIQMFPDAVDALARLGRLGWTLVLVTNQSGVGRGVISPEESAAVQARFMEVMNEARVPFAGVYICDHKPEDGCECRKPSPYFLLLAAREHDIDLAKSWMAGDRASDVEAGRSAGCSTIWLRNPVHSVDDARPTFVADSWDDIYGRLSCEA